MSENDLVERLLAHRTLGSAPREQLEWLAAHGSIRRFEVGEVMAPKGAPIDSLYVVLSGRLFIQVDRAGGPRTVMGWRAGDVTGYLPFSRLAESPGVSTAEEPSEVLAMSRDHFPEMIRECPDLTAILVHVMLDRARRFNTSELHDEKLVSLGRLSAGVAHELNNPASALARSSKELCARLIEMEMAALTLGAEHLTPEQGEAIRRARDASGGRDALTSLTPLERADREDEIAGWLQRRGVRGVAAEALAETALGIDSLDRLADKLGPDSIGLALISIGAGHRARVLATEIEIAAERVHNLVAAIKGFAYMDQSNIPMSVDIGKGLTNTLTLLGGKARHKEVAVTLKVAADLPAIQGLGGDLNQVWQNLIVNAIEAVPPKGRVDVSAERRGDNVVVRVVDNGPGVPPENVRKVFEPFFTSKPQGEGTGLGLDIASRLVREHHGRIELESRPGHTEFRVTLPFA